MGILKEVWVEFGDGSIAKYQVKAEDFPMWMDRLHNAGVARAIWVDGRAWTPGSGVEGADTEP